MPRQNVWMFKCTFLITYGIFIITRCGNDCNQCSTQVVIVNCTLIYVLLHNVIDEVLDGDAVVLSSEFDVLVTPRWHVQDESFLLQMDPPGVSTGNCGENRYHNV